MKNLQSPAKLWEAPLPNWHMAPFKGHPTMFKHLFRRYLPLALILALVLTASFGSTGEAAAAGEVGLARAIAAQEANTSSLMAIDGVIGTAVGRGSGGGHVVLALTTASGVSGIPGAVDGVIVRPYVTGEITALKGKPGGVDPTARFDRPVPIGVSTGHPDITAGTIGARVTDGTNVYALSNNHVYANQNAASIGDAVIQPGTYDGGSSPTDDIGTLSDFEPIVFSTSANNVIDAAIALSSTTNLGNATPSDGYGLPSATTLEAVVGMNVMKYGRTTGQTKSQISAINATLNVGYGSGTARFVGQVIISGGQFSAGGDSGSLIVTEIGSNPVALLFAGSQTTTVGNPINAVLARFGVTIDGDGSAPPPPTTTGSISGTVTDAGTGDPIGGAGVSTDSGQSTTTDGSGNYTLSDVPTGTRSVTASASGFASSTAQTSVSEDVTSTLSFALTAVQTGVMTVDSIDYTTSGGKGGTKDLRVTLSVIDVGNGSGIEGASVSITLNFDGSSLAGTGSTGADGTVTFRLRNAPSATYTTVVTGVVAADFDWDGGYPENSFTK